VFSFIPPFVATVECGVCGLCGGSGHGGCGVRPLRKLTVHFWFCFRSFCGSVSPFKRAAQYAPELGGARASAVQRERTAQVAGRHGSCWHLMLHPSAAYSTYCGSH
jgi:hypothetical protein